MRKIKSYVKLKSMKSFYKFMASLLLILSCILTSSCDGSSSNEVDDIPLSAIKTANPLMGFATWASSPKNDVPCSLEYVPFHFSDVLTASNTCDFSKFEEKLNAAKKRRHQVIVRFIIDDTGTGLYLPSFLSSVNKYAYTYGEKTYKSPDYNDSTLLNQILFFIGKLAKEYDGDPRIANIETGLIGHWGEHHVHYCKDKQSISNDTWKQFFQKFSDSFSETCISVRSPSHCWVSECDNLGYYNDMVYSDADDEYFRKMLATDSALPDRWKLSMVTGEFAPPEQVSFLADCNKSSVFNKYKERVGEFHVSSLLFNKAFSSSQKKELLLAASNALGYEFSVTALSLSSSENTLTVSLTITNQGIAPFYYKWPVILAFASNGSVGKKVTTDWDITSIAPGQSKDFTYTLDQPPSDSALLLGIPNPMEGGYPVSFANAGQDADVEGWLTLR